MLLSLVLLVYLQVLLCIAVKVSFKDVTLRGFRDSEVEFQKHISSSNNLNEFLPESFFNKIEIKDQVIPIIYENAIVNLRELQELLIESSGVSKIKPGAFKNLSYIRMLSLKGNFFIIYVSDVVCLNQ